MAEPKRFGGVMQVTFPYMTSMYVLSASSAYGVFGGDTPSFLLDVLPFSWQRRFAGALLFFHIAVAYLVDQHARRPPLPTQHTTRMVYARSS